MDKINKLLRRRETLLTELTQLDQLVAGSFFKRDMNGAVRFCLSCMQDGKQRQTYISAKQADAVRRGVKQYSRAIDILSEVGKINLELIKRGRRNTHA